MQYLADSVPDRQLLAPVNSLARYHTLEWLNYIATELHKGFTPLFRPDTPETLKPAVRAALERNFSMWMSRFQTISGFAASVLPSQTLICLPYCVGPMA